LFSSLLFHFLMAYEGQSYSWVTGVYWTLTTMTTLGLGDIVFHSDIGKAFTAFILVSGVVYLLVIVPFVIVQLFQSSARVPREVPRRTVGHVIITGQGPLATTLLDTVRRYGYHGLLVVPNLSEAISFLDRGLPAAFGEPDNMNTFRLLRANQAALVAATGTTTANTNIIYAVRQTSATVPTVATAADATGSEVLRSAGCTHVLTLDQVLGQALARRTIAGDAIAHVIGQVSDLIIAEATVAGTPLVDKTLREIRLRELSGLHVIGVWERGRFTIATSSTRISAQTVLILAGTERHVEQYNELFCIYNVASAPVVIIGGGNVGLVVADSFTGRGLAYKVVDKENPIGGTSVEVVLGDAADPKVLQKAGIMDAPAAVITTHDDDSNVYVTALIRHLRPDIQIISRATRDRTVRTLHAAGCNFVVSYASMGSTMILNLLRHGKILMLEEGVDVFQVALPPSLAEKRIRETRLREQSGCSIVAVVTDGEMHVNPGPDMTLKAGSDIVLVGTVEAEKQFLHMMGIPGAGV
jgi:voltage-gated potassium channel